MFYYNVFSTVLVLFLIVGSRTARAFDDEAESSMRVDPTDLWEYQFMLATETCSTIDDDMCADNLNLVSQIEESSDFQEGVMAAITAGTIKQTLRDYILVSRDIGMKQHGLVKATNVGIVSHVLQSYRYQGNGCTIDDIKRWGQMNEGRPANLTFGNVMENNFAVQIQTCLDKYIKALDSASKLIGPVHYGTLRSLANSLLKKGLGVVDQLSRSYKITSVSHFISRFLVNEIWTWIKPRPITVETLIQQQARGPTKTLLNIYEYKIKNPCSRLMFFSKEIRKSMQDFSNHVGALLKETLNGDLRMFTIGRILKFCVLLTNGDDLTELIQEYYRELIEEEIKLVSSRAQNVPKLSQRARVININ